MIKIKDLIQIFVDLLTFDNQIYMVINKLYIIEENKLYNHIFKQQLLTPCTCHEIIYISQLKKLII